MKTLLIAVFVLGVSSAFVAGPAGDPEREYYQIIELVLRKENATKIYQQAGNDRFFAATDSLKKLYDLTGDTSFRFTDHQRARLLAQGKRATVATWDKKKIYHFTIVDKDKVADVSASVMDFKISSEYKSENGKTLSIHRVSTPLYKNANEAIVYVEFGMIGVLNDQITFREGHQKVYLVRKNHSHWSVVKAILIGGS